MISTIFNAVLYKPLYNGLILLIDLPLVDAGLAVILLTLIVKFALFPLSKKAVLTQLKLKDLQEPLKELQERHKDDRQALAMETLALYRKHGVNPFSAILPLLIQIPIVLALYWVFFKGGLPIIDPAHLYSFVPSPGVVDTSFFGIFDITEAKNLWLAAIVGITFYVQAAVTTQPPTGKPGESMSADFARSMHIQSKYVFPFIMFWIAFGLKSVIAVYWITSNLFAIAQYLHLNKYKKS